MSALVLALDTSTESIGLGLARCSESGIEVLASEAIVAPRRANTLLLTSVVERLSEFGVGIGDIECIIVGRGPGSFTGVRIGVAAAKGLAQGLGVELYGVSTTEAVAWEVARVVATGTVAVVGDAMRGEVYPGLFRVDGGRVLSATPDCVASPADVAEEWRTGALGELTLAGNGLLKHADVFRDALGATASFAPDATWYPTGYGLLMAWGRAMDAGAPQTGDPAEVLPVYTRLSDAEENERLRLGADAAALPNSGVAGPSSSGRGVTG